MMQLTMLEIIQTVVWGIAVIGPLFFAFTSANAIHSQTADGLAVSWCATVAVMLQVASLVAAYKAGGK